MARYRSYRIARVAVCAIVGFVAAPTTTRAQGAVGTPTEAEARSTAAKASPELVNGLAKELGSTPEQAAGVAGVLFSLTKSFVKPEDFAAMSKAVPGMDALLAATPNGVVGTPGASAAPSRAMMTPGIASTGGTMAASDGMSSAVAGLSKLGIKPEMLLKAVPFLSGFLKKFGGAGLGSLLESLFKGAGSAGK